MKLCQIDLLIYGTNWQSFIKIWKKIVDFSLTLTFEIFPGSYGSVSRIFFDVKCTLTFYHRSFPFIITVTHDISSFISIIVCTSVHLACFTKLYLLIRKFFFQSVKKRILSFQINHLRFLSNWLKSQTCQRPPPRQKSRWPWIHFLFTDEFVFF